LSEFSSDHAVEAMQLVEKISPLLAGKHPAVQSAALCDLVSMWLSGVFMLGDEDATNKVREQMLANFVDTVRKLIRVNEEVITKPKLKEMFKQ
jgi:hypothetical protein